MHPACKLKKGSINITVMHRIAFRRQFYMSVKVTRWLCDELRKALELTLWSLWTAMTVEQQLKHMLPRGGGGASLVARASVEVRTTRGSLSSVASLMGGTSVVATDSLTLVVSLVGATAIMASVGLQGGTAVAGSELGNKALPQSPAPVREADPRVGRSQPLVIRD
ncbi:hypothetical protein ISCGN_007341 [Ixodes scapularis]